MSRRNGITKWSAVRLGLFAVLFQAVLFGWHHHGLVLTGRSTVPVVANPTTPPHAVDDENGCEICQVLHHLSAAPVDFAGPPLPFGVVAAAVIPGPAFAAGASALAFHARAPPSSDAATG